jgi:type IV pilus assembly protein PilA
MTREHPYPRRDERGFSLPELMVVVLVIAILIAIVLPTFISARARADNRAAQTSLRHALIAAKAMYTDQATFAAADESPTGLPTVEPNLSFVVGGRPVGFGHLLLDP